MLVEHAADAFFVFDRRGRLVDVNQQACDSLRRAGNAPLMVSPSTSSGLALSNHDLRIASGSIELLDAGVSVQLGRFSLVAAAESIPYVLSI